MVPPSSPPVADTHLHFLLEYCDGGELYALLNSQGSKRLKETAVRFYAAEVLLALQYLHLLGFVYRWGVGAVGACVPPSFFSFL